MTFKDKKVFITGINGFVGTALARRLLKEGAKVYGMVKEINSIPPQLDGCTIYAGDINDFETIKNIISYNEIQIIYHFAAYAIVRVSSKDPINAYRVNVMGTVNVLEAARQIGGVEKIIVASSDKAYGDHDNLPYTEQFSLKPKNTYDTSKACMDMISSTYAHNYGMPVIITRCSNIYGPGDSNTSRIIPNTIKRILNGEPPMLYKDVEGMEREFIYIEDVVDAYLLLYLSNITNDVFNIGGTGPTTILNLVDTISTIMKCDKKPKIVERFSTFKEINKQYIDAKKLNAATGWSPKFNLQQGLEKCVEWYTKYYNEGIFE